MTNMVPFVYAHGICLTGIREEESVVSHLSY